MIKFSLFDSKSNDTDSAERNNAEKQESKLFNNYTIAIELQGNGKLDDAEKQYIAILDHDLIKNSTNKSKEALVKLKYLVVKNLALLYRSKKENNSALKYYLQVKALSLLV